MESPKRAKVESNDDSIVEIVKYDSFICGEDEQMTIKKEIRKDRSKKEVLSSLTQEQILKMKAQAFDYLVKRMKGTGSEELIHLSEVIGDLVDDEWDFLDVQRTKDEE